MGDGEVAFWRGLYRSAVLHVHPDRSHDMAGAQAWFDAVHQNFLQASFAPLVRLAGHLWSRSLLGAPARGTHERGHLRRHWKTRLHAARRLLDGLRSGPAMGVWAAHVAS
jgi:hypothetical protein